MMQGRDPLAAEPGPDPKPRLSEPIPEETRSFPPRWGWGVLAVLLLIHVLDSFDRWLLPAVSPAIGRDLELSDPRTGWLATILLLSFAAWSPVVGYLADRWSRSRLLAVGVAIWSLATVSSGLARSYDQLQLARVLVGIGGSTFAVIALTLLMDLFPREMRARVLAAFFLAIPLGAALGLNLGPAIARWSDWHMAFLAVGAPGVVLSLISLGIPNPVRGASEGVDEQRLRLHEGIGPSQEDYIDLMVNSSYTYSVFGLAFSMFAVAGLVYWLPMFLTVVREIPAIQVSSWLSLAMPAAIVLGIGGGGWLADRYSRSNRRAPFVVSGTAMLCSIPFVLLSLFARHESLQHLSVFVALVLMFSNLGACYSIIANVVMPNMRGVACAVALSATHLLGDIWSPSLMGWVADTFGQADSMATPFGRALAAIGAVPKALPGHDPENLVAALLTTVPALLIAGIVLLAGARHLPREMALMQAKLRAAPTSGRHRRPAAPVPGAAERPGPGPLKNPQDDK